MTMRIKQVGNFPKVLFVISSTAQADMFASICKHLIGWNIEVINTDKLSNKSEMENVLKSLKFSFKTIKSMDRGYIDRILAEIQPEVVVFGHDRNVLDRLFIETANAKKIPTLLIQDGVLAAKRDIKLETGSINIGLKYWLSSPLKTLLFFFRSSYPWKTKIEIALFELKYGNRGKSGIYGHGECSKIAVFSDTVKKMFLSEGIASERIVVTGNPKFDAIFKARFGNCKERVCRELGIPADEDIILLITSYFVESGEWTPEQRRDFVLGVSGAAAKLPDTQLVIKLHPPYENENDYYEIVKNLSPRPVICKYANLPELINASNLIVTVSSTAGLEAMAMEKPVLIIHFDEDYGASFYRGSGALFAEKVDDILPMMQKALYDLHTREEMRNSMSEFVFDQAYLQDGQASKRIADLIKHLALNENFPGCED